MLAPLGSSDLGGFPYVAVITRIGARSSTPDNRLGTRGRFDVYLRYTITIRGCSNCYASTDVVEGAPHKDLLEKNVYSEDLWDNLDVAHRLVPLWAIGQASIDWVEGETDKGLLKCRTAEHKQEERARG